MFPELAVKASRRNEKAQTQQETGGSQNAMSELEKLKAELAAAKSRIGQLEAEKSVPDTENNTPVRTTQPELSGVHQTAPPQQQMQHSHYQTSPVYPPPHHPSYTPMNRPVHAQGVPQPSQSPVSQQLHSPTSGESFSLPYWLFPYGKPPHLALEDDRLRSRSNGGN
jgi:hypothetical protein